MTTMDEAGRRRTFAIISHPDAGKTTITEKLLLYAGALRVAGSIKGRKGDRHATSDFMEMERERGISISSSVLQFDYRDLRMNLVDTPGHADFSEDTYRTLSAVDSAIMLIDAVKGVEDRTRRLFEVCRMRNLPIVTFINKMDRVGRDPVELMDEVASALNIRTSPLTWPIGQGPDFRGVVNLRTRMAHLYERNAGGSGIAPERILALDDPRLEEEIGESQMRRLADEIDLLDAGDPWDKASFLAGETTPFFFGSAMSNFGLAPLLEGLAELTPPPGSRPAAGGHRSPDDPDFSAFVFKIQANMNPRHHDRIAFLRIASGRFDRGMSVVIARNGELLRLSKPHSFVAAEREIIEEAVPGDIVGVFDPGALRIGDTLYTGAPVRFVDIPRFAPEHFARIQLKDPSRRKQLQSGLEQLSQEGAVQLFYREGMRSDPYMGAVGLLQFDVLLARLESEYNVAAGLTTAPFALARWLINGEAHMRWFAARPDYLIVRDRDEHPVVLFTAQWALQAAFRHCEGLKLLDTSPLGGE